MTIGERIKKIRIEKGMTQKELAEKCGMFDSALRRIENGKQNPKKETVEKVAHALNLPVAALLYDTTDEILKDMINYLVKEDGILVKAIDDKGNENIISYNEWCESERIENLVENYKKLNTIGQQKANEYITDLSEQEKYTKPDEE